MRNTQVIFKLVKEVPKFTHDDLTLSIFEQKGPQYTCYPFTLFRYPLNLFPVIYNLGNVDIDRLDVLNIDKYIIKVGISTFISSEALLKIPPYLYSFIVTAFKTAVSSWYEYVIREMDSYCEDPISQLHWSVVKNGLGSQLFPSLNLEQKLWAAINSKKDKDFWLNTIVEVREGLLPWLDNKLYQIWEKKKANTRENSAYEKQRLEMINGNLKDISIENSEEIAKFNNVKKEETSFSRNVEGDLDIIS